MQPQTRMDTLYIFSEGQRSDINFALPVFKHIDIEGSRMSADREYDSHQLIDYIYENGGEPTSHSKKERNLRGIVTGGCIRNAILLRNTFLILKGFRRIAARYDKLAFTYMGFVCLASILIWIK